MPKPDPPMPGGGGMGGMGGMGGGMGDMYWTWRIGPIQRVDIHIVDIQYFKLKMLSLHRHSWQTSLVSYYYICSASSCYIYIVFMLLGCFK